MSRSSDLPARLLVIDDNPAIHEDFRKILQPSDASNPVLDAFEQEMFGGASRGGSRKPFRLDSAFQGQEGLERVTRALQEGDPYALAFVDVRMPPGWDGILTLEHIWKVCPDLQAVICTAYSDYSWEEMQQRFGERDNLLVLRKPFETMEVLQIAHAMARKGELLRATRHHLEHLDRTVRERTEDLHAARTSLRQVHDERGRVEEALKQSEERFVRAFHASPIPMVIKDAGRARFLDANPAFLQLTGFSVEEIQQENVFSEPTFQQHDILAGTDPSCHTRLRNQQLTLRRRDKTTRQTLVSREPMKVADIPCQLFILQDITEQLALEDRLRQAQKMEAIGLLASGIAHEFNNILTVIQCNADLLHTVARPASPEMARLDQILNAGKQAASLTNQLLAFSRKRMLQRRLLNIRQVLSQTHAMLESLLGERYELRLTCPDHLPLLLADEDNLSQVVMNLVLNARDAMADGGTLRVSVSHIILDEHQAGALAEGRPGSFIALEVKDDGPGMDTEVLQHLFEPFFTTKETGKGTGLGLSTIHGIVKQHEGWITVSSKRNQGSTFTVYLPTCEAAQGPEDAAATPAITEVPRGHGEHVLVVEDEPALREIVCEVLREYQYTVSEARDGDEALRRFEEALNPVDLLVTDLVMPGGTTGVELARKLTAANPQLRILFTSGYSSEIVGSDSPLERGVPFLAKPYEPSRLLVLVHQTLQDPRAAWSGCFLPTTPTPRANPAESPACYN